MKQKIEEILVPELGEGIESADVVSLLVAVGDEVEAEQALVEVESDKASLEIPSPAAGRIEEIRVAAGDKIQVGQVIVTLALQDGTKAKSATKSATGIGTEIAPEIRPEISTGIPSEVDQERAARPAREGAAQPSIPRVVSSSRPVVTANDGYPVNDGHPSNDGHPTIGDSAGLTAVSSASWGMVDWGSIAAAPSVRRMARELGVDIRRVSGRGPGGRISIQDVKAYVKTILHSGSQSATALPASPELPDLSAWGPLRREAMSTIQQRTAEKMALCWSQIVHVTQHDDADLTATEQFRKQKAKIAEKAGSKLTVTAIMLKIVGLALQRFPQFNASIDMERREFIYRQYVNVGVAVDTPHGLVVPVIRDVDRKGIFELSAKLNEIAARAREKKIRPEELKGGGFSLTNLGGLGCGYFTPIVNWPEVAILGMGRSTLRPVWDGQNFAPRLIMPLSISYDHRIINGADAARFLRWIAETIEQPLNMLL